MKNFISIPTPCHENWEAMTPKEQGRHCDKCKIVVKDFTSMSNDEILTFLSKKSGRICGRVNENQLYQKTQVTDKLKRFLYALAMTFLPLFSLTTISSIISTKVYAQTKAGCIKGKIVDNKGEPVPFASVGAFQGGILRGQTKTDFSGNYKIKPLPAGEYTIKIRTVGFKATEIKTINVSNNTTTKTNVTILKKKVLGLLKGIVIDMRPPMIDPINPGKQEISGDEIRRMNGG